MNISLEKSFRTAYCTVCTSRGYLLKRGKWHTVHILTYMDIREYKLTVYELICRLKNLSYKFLFLVLRVPYPWTLVTPNVYKRLVR